MRERDRETHSLFYVNYEKYIIFFGEIRNRENTGQISSQGVDRTGKHTEKFLQKKIFSGQGYEIFQRLSEFKKLFL